MSTPMPRAAETTSRPRTPPPAQVGGADARAPGYWPCELLHAFCLRMAAHGLAVNEGMMLGDGYYATRHLAQAHTLDDELLRRVAVELFRFFEMHRAGLARLN